MNNGTTSRVLIRATGVALSLALTLGYGCLVSWGSHPFDAIFWLVLWAGPAIVASAVVGGVAATAVARVRPQASRASWIFGGVGVGALAGGCHWEAGSPSAGFQMARFRTAKSSVSQRPGRWSA